jgi:hypothetical protein
VIIDADTFFSKIRNVPPWFLRIIRIVSEKIRKADKRLNQAIEEKAAISVTLALSYLFRQFGAGGQRPAIDLAMTQKRLIQLLSLSPQHIVAVIGFLQLHDLVSINEQALACTDIDSLGMYCEFLRRHLRKAYQNTPPLSTSIKEMLIVAVQGAPKILEHDSSDIELGYHELIEKLPHRPDEDQCAGMLDKLQELQLCKVIKKRKDDGSGNATPEVALQIHGEPWLNLYLFARYADMVPKL